MCDFGDPNKCTKCKSSLLVLNGTCVSSCPEGYLVKEDQCIAFEENYEVLYLK
jgi:ferredoxin